MRRFRNFLTDRGGNYAIAAAITAVPLVLGVGVAIDFQTVSRTKTELQQVLDSAALAIAREGMKLSDKDARQIAENFIAANYRDEVSTLSVTRNGYSVNVAATLRPKLAFGGVVGKDKWSVAVDSTAEYMMSKYEIALALDTTGSMKGAKLAAMKAAVNDLVNAMSVQVSNSRNLKVGVVPYAAFVNVGPQHGPRFKKNGKVDAKTGARWLDIKGKVKFPEMELGNKANRFELYYRLGKTWPGCVETRVPDKKKGLAYDVMDIEADPKVSQSLFVPAYSIDEPDDRWRNGQPKYPNSYIKSNVSVLDKTPQGQAKKLMKYGYDPVNDTGGKFGAVRIDDSPSYFYSNEADPKGPGYGCEIEPLLPLTTDLQKVRDKVNALNANGSTNIMEGVMWAWRVLSDREPFTEGLPKSSGPNKKVLILLTDGSNSITMLNNDLGAGYSSIGYPADSRLPGLTPVSSSSVANQALNAKTLAACANAKADDVEIFTIRLEEPDVDTGDMLRQCASGDDHYFDSPSKDDLQRIFQEIKDRMVSVRLSS